MLEEFTPLDQRLLHSFSLDNPIYFLAFSEMIERIYKSHPLSVCVTKYSGLFDLSQVLAKGWTAPSTLSLGQVS